VPVVELPDSPRPAWFRLNLRSFEHPGKGPDGPGATKLLVQFRKQRDPILGHGADVLSGRPLGPHSRCEGKLQTSPILSEGATKPQQLELRCYEFHAGYKAGKGPGIVSNPKS